MTPIDSALRKQVEEPAPLFRSAPHNIEAEQGLLGAILVNNEAFYRVSDFLNPEHFFEPIHQKVYQISRDLIRAGKIATPVTLKTFLDANTDIGGMTLGQYLARLAAEATTIINSEDYGHTIYDRRFVRMWEFYLAAAEMSFREQALMVFQIQLTKRQDVVPMTRDYIMREEQRLLAAEGRRRPPLRLAGE